MKLKIRKGNFLVNFFVYGNDWKVIKPNVMVHKKEAAANCVTLDKFDNEGQFKAISVFSGELNCSALIPKDRLCPNNISPRRLVFGDVIRDLKYKTWLDIYYHH